MSVELPDTNVPGVHGNIFRNAQAGPSLCTKDGDQTMYEAWRTSVAKYGKLPCVGYRPINAKGVAGPYKWSTYAEIDERAANFAAGLVKSELVPPTEDFKGGLLGFYAKNRMEWTVGEQACNRMGVVAVPLYDTLGEDAVRYVLDQTLTGCVLCTSDVAGNMIAAATGGSTALLCLVLMDGTPAAIKKLSEQAAATPPPNGKPIIILDFAEVERIGKENPCPPRPPKPSDVAFFCYTSGTTGDPKGGMITHSNMITNVAGGTATLGTTGLLKDDGSTVHLSYLPLPHVYERCNQFVVQCYGGRIGFYQGDTLKILEDLVELRPTFFASVPRLLSRIHDKLLAGVEEAGGLKKTLFNTALSSKMSNLHSDKEGAGSLTHRVWDPLVFGPLKKRLGLDRVEVIATGSAPLAGSVMSFLRAVFGPVVEGYGQTETAAGGSMTTPGDYTTGHVGVPGPSCEIALFDVPEMGYNSTDLIHGDDMPVRGRGEICFRGPCIFAGYYKMPEKTAETIDSEGWLHSGDIGVWTKDGKLKIVDRKKNIFKLSQGEYVAVEKVENIYMNCSLVQMIFVYGDSLQSSLVAIAVPDEEALTLWASKPENGIDGKGKSFIELCKDPKVVAGVMKQMTECADEAKLKGFEKARALMLEPDPFSVEKGILTPTFKLKRQAARDHYRSVIDDLYASMVKAKL